MQRKNQQWQNYNRNEESSTDVPELSDFETTQNVSRMKVLVKEMSESNMSEFKRMFQEYRYWSQIYLRLLCFLFWIATCMEHYSRNV